MRKAVMLRLDPDLLTAVRHCATMENWTLTNFIETAVRQRIAASAAGQTTSVVSLSFREPSVQTDPQSSDEHPYTSSDNAS